MDETRSTTVSHARLHRGNGLLGIGAAVLLLQAGCDDFFSMKGTLYRCGTVVPIAGANGSAGPDGREPERFVTDSLGRFSFVLVPIGPGNKVTVNFVKEGFTPFSQLFEGEPKRDVELCMEPVVQP